MAKEQAEVFVRRNPAPASAAHRPTIPPPLRAPVTVPPKPAAPPPVAATATPPPLPPTPPAPTAAPEKPKPPPPELPPDFPHDTLSRPLNSKEQEFWRNFASGYVSSFRGSSIEPPPGLVGQVEDFADTMIESLRRRRIVSAT